MTLSLQVSFRSQILKNINFESNHRVKEKKQTLTRYSIFLILLSSQDDFTFVILLPLPVSSLEKLGFKLRRCEQLWRTSTQDEAHSMESE